MFGNLLEFLEKVSIITSVFFAIKKWLPGLFPGLGVREMSDVAAIVRSPLIG